MEKKKSFVEFEILDKFNRYLLQTFFESSILFRIFVNASVDQFRAFLVFWYLHDSILIIQLIQNVPGDNHLPFKIDRRILFDLVLFIGQKATLLIKKIRFAHQLANTLIAQFLWKMRLGKIDVQQWLLHSCFFRVQILFRVEIRALAEGHEVWIPLLIHLLKKTDDLGQV